MQTDNLIDPVTNLKISDDKKCYLATCLGGIGKTKDIYYKLYVKK